MSIVSDAAQSRGDVMRRLADLERQVQELSAARRLEAATIGEGGVTINGGTLRIQEDGSLIVEYDNEVEALRAGPAVLTDGTPVHAIVIRRPGNELTWWTYGIDGGATGFWAFYDKTGNIIFSDDAASGQGLATPYITGAFESMSVPSDSNGTGTFTGLQKAIWRKQHPRVKFTVLANVTSTTAEIRWKIVSGPDTGTVIGGPTTLNTGFGFNHYGPFTVPGGHLTEFEIDLEARVASGAGAVAVRTLHAIGIQSP